MNSSDIPNTAPLAITYEVPDLTALAAKYTGLTATTKQGYEETRVAIGELRKLRVAVETRRKELKAGALEYGRSVDSAAALLTLQIEAIEGPLKLAKSAVDDAKAQEKAAREESGRRMLEDAAAQRLQSEREALARERAEFEAQRAVAPAPPAPTPAPVPETDTDKVCAVAAQIRSIIAAPPTVSSYEAWEALRVAFEDLEKAAQALDGFTAG